MQASLGSAAKHVQTNLSTGQKSPFPAQAQAKASTGRARLPFWPRLGTGINRRRHSQHREAKLPIRACTSSQHFDCCFWYTLSRLGRCKRASTMRCHHRRHCHCGCSCGAFSASSTSFAPQTPPGGPGAHRIHRTTPSPQAGPQAPQPKQPQRQRGGQRAQVRRSASHSVRTAGSTWPRRTPSCARPRRPRWNRQSRSQNERRRNGGALRHA